LFFHNNWFWVHKVFFYLYKKLISKGLANIMTLQNTKILLDKINALHKSIETDVQISGIERDLMLSYTRQFYEAFLLMGNDQTPVMPANLPVVESPRVAPKVTPVVVAPVVEKVVVVPPPIIEAIVEPVIEKKVVPPPIVEPVVEKVVAPPPPPVVVERPSPIVEYIVHREPVVVAQPQPTPAPKVEEIKPIPQTVFPEPPRPKAAAKPLVKPANERVDQSELFEEKMSKELSDKLGETAIDDIKKGMTLNDRILFMRDLFLGKQEEFDAAVYALNNAGSFDAARRELSELAYKFDWASKEKQAKPFIRLVRRRYN
jgi:hypothetical protein